MCAGFLLRQQRVRPGETEPLPGPNCGGGSARFVTCVSLLFCCQAVSYLFLFTVRFLASLNFSRVIQVAV